MENLTLVIPAKNEKESLPIVLNELKKFNIKILIVLEKNDLETIDSIKDFNCVILYQSNKGYGDALIEGINNTKTKYFCIFNADGSFVSDELEKMYTLLENKHSDFVFGSRYMKNASSDDDTLITYIGNKIFSFIGNFFFSLEISDILYTYVMGNTELAQSLNLKEKKFSLCVELPIKAKRSGFKIISFPCHERRRFAGKKKVNAFRDGFLILISMVKLFFTKSVNK
jgi:glycosyltransferase involved in cell wall biosynthesis